MAVQHLKVKIYNLVDFTQNAKMTVLSSMFQKAIIPEQVARKVKCFLSLFWETKKGYKYVHGSMRQARPVQNSHQMVKVTCNIIPQGGCLGTIHHWFVMEEGRMMGGAVVFVSWYLKHFLNKIRGLFVFSNL